MRLGRGRARLFIEDVYTLAGLLRDANGDGFPDTVAATVVLGDNATPLEGVAAVHIAARLGLESLGLQFPLVRRASDIAGVAPDHALLVVGTHNSIYEQLVSQHGVDWSGLEPRDGLIQVVERAIGDRDVILIAGQTDEGTLAAANYLATAVLPGSDVTTTTAYRRGHELCGDEPAPSAGLHKPCLIVRADRVAATRVPSSRDDIDHLSLSRLYGLDGYLRDHDDDLLPDGTNLTLVLPAAGPADLWAATADLAARVGLESGGLTFPLAILDADVPTHEHTGGLGGVVMIGNENRLTRALAIRRPTSSAAEPIDGGVAGARFVARAFGNNGALVITGRDPKAERTMLCYLATRAPFLAAVQRGEPTLGDLEQAVIGLVSARSAAGQAGAALVELQTLAEEMLATGRPLETIGATAFVDAPDAGLTAYLQHTLEASLTTSVSVDVQAVDVKAPSPLVHRDETFRWEVEDFWTIFTEAVEPKLGPESGPTTIDVRLSETRAIRERIKDQVESRLLARAVPVQHIDVRILSAYKQGYSWLEEVVLPAVRAEDVASIHIRFQRFDLPVGAGWVDVPVAWMEMAKPAPTRRLFGMAGAIDELRKAGVVPCLGSPTRWLQELYPIDETLATALGLERDDVRFEMADIPSTYEVECLDEAGAVIYNGSLSVPYVERDYLEPYPEWGKVHVTTGWLAASCGGHVLVDQRIVTDLEQIWDSYQSFLPVIEEHVLAATGGNPTPDKQPFIREVRFEIWVSEPNEQMALRHEIFSSLEALHEDLYFVTLDFFKALGNKHVGTALQAPGQLIPLVHSAPGAAGRATFSIKGFAAPRPMISLRATFADRGSDHVLRRDLTGVARSASLAGIGWVGDGDRLTAELVLRDAVNDAAERLRMLAGATRTLEAAGLYSADLTWPHIRTVTVRTADGSGAVALCTGRGTAPAPVSTRPADTGPVPLDHVIGYEETASILRSLAAHSEANVWPAGRTFLGRSVYALDLMLPTGTPLWSQAKASIFKPTCHVNCRHHANEASATNAALWLAELLLKDPDYRSFLRRVNVCMVPFENADGAVLHHELQREHPTWMHHAARYNAAGLEFANEYFREDSKFPEATARPATWRTWLPDLVVDCHERPGHEWRQLFAGYAPPALPYLWILPSLFTGIMHYTDTPDHPHHLRVARALRQAVVDEINADDEIRSWNLDWQDRYRKYAHDWTPASAPTMYHDDVQFHFSPLVPNPAATDLMQRNPQVTAVSFITEVADETPQGDFMALCARATLTANRAVLALLANASYSVVRTATKPDPTGHETRIALLRPRPILPATRVTAPP